MGFVVCFCFTETAFSGIMFGDVGHGLMLLLSAIVIILFEGKLLHSICWLCCKLCCIALMSLYSSSSHFISSSHHHHVILLFFFFISHHFSCFCLSSHLISPASHLISLVLFISHLIITSSLLFLFIISSAHLSKGRFSRQSKDELGQFGTVFRARYLLLLMV